MRIPLIDAVTNPRLLGATITWRPKQLEVLRMFGDDDLRLVVCAAGRQGGKSSMAVATAIWGATCRDDLDELLPRGRTRYALLAAPSESQSRELIRVASAMIEASPVLRSLATIRADEITFALPSGARTALRALPANPRSVRGMTASIVVADECAWFNREDQLNNDTEMLLALEASMSVFDAHGKSKLCLLSTPRGHQGRFWDLFCQARDGLLDAAAVVHAPAWELNPALDSEEWKESKRRLLGVDGFLQEHGAEFTVGGGQFFDLRGMEFEDGPARPEDGHRWICGLDPGFHADRFSAVLVGESRTERGVLLVGAIAAIDPGGRLLSFERRRAREDRALARVWETVEPYHPIGIVSDQHQADAVTSYFGRAGVPTQIFNLTAPLQTSAFVSTRTRLLDGSVRLWRHELLLEEMRRVRASEGMERIVLPRFGGGHCDVISGLCLGVYAKRYVNDNPPPEIRDPIRLDLARDSPVGRAVDGVDAPGGRPDVDGARALPSVHEPPGFWDREPRDWRTEQF
jgi:hypothetical protein